LKPQLRGAITQSTVIESTTEISSLDLTTTDSQHISSWST